MTGGLNAVRAVRSAGLSRRRIIILMALSAPAALVAACSGEDVKSAPLRRFAAGSWRVEVKNPNEVTTFTVNIASDGSFVIDGYRISPSNPYLTGVPFASGKWTWEGSRVKLFELFDRNGDRLEKASDSADFESGDIPASGGAGAFTWVRKSIVGSTDSSYEPSPDQSMNISAKWDESSRTLILRRTDESAITITARQV